MGLSPGAAGMMHATMSSLSPSPLVLKCWYTAFMHANVSVLSSPAVSQVIKTRADVYKERLFFLIFAQSAGSRQNES